MALAEAPPTAQTVTKGPVVLSCSQVHLKIRANQRVSDHLIMRSESVYSLVCSKIAVIACAVQWGPSVRVVKVMRTRPERCGNPEFPLQAGNRYHLA